MKYKRYRIIFFTVFFSGISWQRRMAGGTDFLWGFSHSHYIITSNECKRTHPKAIGTRIKVDSVQTSTWLLITIMILIWRVASEFSTLSLRIQHIVSPLIILILYYKLFVNSDVWLLCSPSHHSIRVWIKCFFEYISFWSQANILKANVFFCAKDPGRKQKEVEEC